MGGLAVTAKYVVEASIEVDGIVEKSDVIGGIFGQTEGLLGEELDLRELQKSGRIGRIEVKLEVKGRKTTGEIVIPSNLDRVETALLAAAIETVDKIGPYNAKVRVKRIRDMRVEKRKLIIERAKELLRNWIKEEEPELKRLVEEIAQAVRATELIKYGPEGLPAGPEVDKGDTIIVVEGRADVINLLKHGYRNVIALEGVTIPRTIVELSKKKTVIAFIDGDRGGDLVLRNLVKAVDVDYVARAPPGREVEELTGKEIAKCLRNKVSVEEYFAEMEKKVPPKVREEIPEEVAEVIKIEIPDGIKDLIQNLKGTLEGVLFDENWKEVEKIPVRDLVKRLEEVPDGSVKYIVFDGIVTQRVVDAAFKKNVRILIGARKGNISKLPADINILTFDEVLGH
ncbi:MAG: DNA primase [Thermoprotei archaeon]|nr:MAG: DNA primase [Thermoprotei archaeon]